jgi:4a-hydroxytetrahydrobiopterin dehydratase
MNDLTTIRCVGCEGGIPVMTKDEVKEYLTQIPLWTLSPDGKTISRNYAFKNFYQTMAFVNAVAWVANQENHHPDLEVGYNYCRIKFFTHAVDGLTQNDFICAAKINLLDITPPSV